MSSPRRKTLHGEAEDADVFEVANLFSNWFLEPSRKSKADSSKSKAVAKSSYRTVTTKSESGKCAMGVSSLMDSILGVERGEDYEAVASGKKKKGRKKKKKKGSSQRPATELFDLGDGKDHLYNPTSLKRAKAEAQKRKSGGTTLSAIAKGKKGKASVIPKAKTDAFDFDSLLCCLNQVEKDNIQQLKHKLDDSHCVKLGDRTLLQRIVAEHFMKSRGLCAKIRHLKKRTRKKRTKKMGKRQTYDSRIARKIQARNRKNKLRRKAKW